MNSDLVGLQVKEANSGVEIKKKTSQRTTRWRQDGELTGLCPAGWVSYGRSAPGPGPADCVPRWSWPHC